MELNKINDIIKKSLYHYDCQNIKYKKLINNNNIYFDETKKTITFNDENNEIIITYNYELLSYFDNQHNIWIWAWVLPDFNYIDTSECRYLLDYGLKIESTNSNIEQTMIKGILVNSRIKIEEYIQLEINLSMYSYLVKDRIKFIYERKRYTNDNNDTYITYYYFIK